MNMLTLIESEYMTTEVNSSLSIDVNRFMNCAKKQFRENINMRALLNYANFDQKGSLENLAGSHLAEIHLWHWHWGRVLPAGVFCDAVIPNNKLQ